jgi:hypothetical protein
MTTASNPYTPLEIGRRSVRTPAAATPGAGLDTPVQIADSPTVNAGQPFCDAYHKSLANPVRYPSQIQVERSPH